jgi:hypothetical protein
MEADLLVKDCRVVYDGGEVVAGRARGRYLRAESPA